MEAKKVQNIWKDESKLDCESKRKEIFGRMRQKKNLANQTKRGMRRFGWIGHPAFQMNHQSLVTRPSKSSGKNPHWRNPNCFDH